MFFFRSLYFTETKAKLTFFIFFGLIIFSISLFVFAENTPSSQTIFEDSDQDGLSNDEEKLYGTDPLNKDTDDDGYSDGIEINSGYNPLKPAPGDKMIADEKLNQASEETLLSSSASTDNLTNKASNEITNLIKETEETGSDISMEDINASVEKILEQGNTEIVLPEVNEKDIKIKKIKKSLSEKKKDEQKRKDALEYLTVISYLIANNTPKSFGNQNELKNIATQISTQSLLGLTSGDVQSLNSLSEKGEKILKEIKDVEVPEDMVDIHIKTLKLALYAQNLKNEIKPTESDPLGQIVVMAKMQAFFINISDIGTEVEKKLSDYGIEEIPLDL